MDTIHNWPVSLRWDSYSIQGWPVHNPNIGLHPMAGQPAADEYNTRLASQSKMGIMQDWPVSQRWIQYTTGQSVYNDIHIQYRAGQPAADGYTQDCPVSQRWIQYTTGQSVYNEIHIQYRAGQSNSNGPTTSTGQSDRDGKCHIWPVH